MRTSTITVVVLIAAVGAVQIVRPDLLESALYPLTAMTAGAVSYGFDVFDVDFIRTGSVFAHTGGFSYEISYQCTGFWAVLLLVGLMLAYRPRSVGMWPAILSSAGLLLALNFLRLLSLFWVGVKFPASFTLAHDVIWPLITILVMFGLIFSPSPQQTPLRASTSRGP